MAEKIGKHIAIYGKGGIGKSTTTSNISAALAEAGYRVIQIGCDPKSDSTNTLRGNNYLPTVLDSLREGNKIHLDDISVKGFGGVLCIESGGPVPGVGCAGRGINAAVNLLQELNLLLFLFVMELLIELMLCHHLISWLYMQLTIFSKPLINMPLQVVQSLVVLLQIV